MDKLKLSRWWGRRRAGERGFTMLEVLSATMVGMIAFTANLAMFNFAARDFAYSRSLTNATNLATEKMNDFKTRTVAEILADAKTDTVTIDGTAYTRAWTVGNVDVDADGTADMIGDIVKIRLTVRWTIGTKAHQVTMATMTTGKPV